jgi:hypothetical protein
MARPVGHLMGLLQAGGGACARWGGSVTSFEIRDAEHVRAERTCSAHRGSAPRILSCALLYRHGLGHLGSHFYMGLRTIADGLRILFLLNS